LAARLSEAVSSSQRRRCEDQPVTTAFQLLHRIRTRRTRGLVLAALALVLLWFGPGRPFPVRSASASESAGASGPAVARGRQVYMVACAGCHGVNGDG